MLGLLGYQLSSTFYGLNIFENLHEESLALLEGVRCTDTEQVGDRTEEVE